MYAARIESAPIPRALQISIKVTGSFDEAVVGQLAGDIVLQVLSFVAENERTNIRQRQAEGIAAAKARGLRFGRPPRPLPENYHSAYQRWKAGAITGTATAKNCGMPLSTFRYRAKIYERPSCCK